METVTKKEFRRDVLDNTIQAQLQSMVVRLFQNDLNPTIDTVLGDFVEADFSGYTEKSAVTFGNSVFQEDNNAVSEAPSQTWVQTAATVTNLVYGYYVLETGGANYLFCARFDEPQTFAGPGDFVTVIPKIGYPTMVPPVVSE